MNKNIVLLFLILFLWGCASTESSSVDNNKPETTSSSVKKVTSKSTLLSALDSGSSIKLFKVTSDILSKNPYDKNALNALAIYHIRKKEFGAAKILINKALEKSKDAGLKNNLAVIELMEDDVEGAVVKFQEAVKIDSDEPTLSRNLSSLYMKYLDYGQAESYVESNYSNNKFDADAANAAAVLARSEGNFEKSETIYKSILEKYSRNTNVLLNYAILLIDYMKKYNEGEKILNKLEFLESGDTYMKQRIGQLHSVIQMARK